MGYKVAVVGATGNVGREMMNVLTERRFPADEIDRVRLRLLVEPHLRFGSDAHRSFRIAGGCA